MVSGKWWLKKSCFLNCNDSLIIKVEERGKQWALAPSTWWAFRWHSPVCALLSGTSEVSTALSSSLSPADSSSEDELRWKKKTQKVVDTHTVGKADHHVSNSGCQRLISLMLQVKNKYPTDFGWTGRNCLEAEVAKVIEAFKPWLTLPYQRWHRPRRGHRTIPGCPLH